MVSKPGFNVECVAHPSLLLSIQPEVQKKGNWTMVSGILWYMRVSTVESVDMPSTLRPGENM